MNLKNSRVMKVLLIVWYWYDLYGLLFFLIILKVLYLMSLKVKHTDDFFQKGITTSQKTSVWFIWYNSVFSGSKPAYIIYKYYSHIMLRSKVDDFRQACHCSVFVCRLPFQHVLCSRHRNLWLFSFSIPVCLIVVCNLRYYNRAGR